MTPRQEQARQSFTSGCNCAQAVLTSFNDILNRDRDDLLSVAAGFGGGMGKLQRTCGAVTGAFMVFGLYAGKYADDNQQLKSRAVDMIREFDARFRSVQGTVSCREILGVDMNTEEGQAEAREKDLFGTVCVDAVVTATGIVEDMILE